MIKKLIPITLALAAMFCTLPMRGDSPPENVKEIPIRKEIEDAVMGAETWNEWQNNMLYLYPYNPTITNVQPLFALW